MPKTLAFMNHGRWLHTCPECLAALPVDRDICPICYPDAMAILYAPVRGNLMRKVPDEELRARAHAKAAANNELYMPVFPAARDQIERVLRMRDRQHMNWEPGESLDMLIADNIEHGDDLPPELERANAI